VNLFLVVQLCPQVAWDPTRMFKIHIVTSLIGQMSMLPIRIMTVLIVEYN